MSQELVISSNPIETTVAVLEENRLVELYVEHHARKALVGSIYKGRVTRVLPGMQSAFVNLGLPRDAFLYVTDVLDPSEGIEDLDAGPIEAEPLPAVQAPSGSKAVPAKKATRLRKDAQQAPKPAGEKGSAEPSKTRPSRRRRRRRRRSRRGRGPTATADLKEGSESALEGKSATITVLPGESIAKSSETPKQNSGSGSPANEPVEKTKAVAESGPTEPSGPPPRQTASVEGPRTIAELRIGVLEWLRGKTKPEPEQPAAPPPAKKQQPARTRRRRRRSRRRKPRTPVAVKSEPKHVPKAAEAKKKGSPRRPPRRRRPRADRGRAPSRGERTKQRPSRPARNGQAAPQTNIKDLLKPGQQVIVQVNKEPVGAKGARITSHVSLPGRYMVYMTTAKHNGVSRKIQPDSERNRLRKIVDKHSSGKAGGFVVRSAARGVSEEVLVADIEFLHKLWSSLQQKAQMRKAPAKLHSDLDITERVLRDTLGQSFAKVWVDSEVEFERVTRFFEQFQPEMSSRIKLYTRTEPIRDSFGITKDLERALKPKVWLKSGGYIVIDQTEALVSIDVNTGRYVGKSNRLEDTVLKTNLEAAAEIVRQLRLRDLGGIIVIDFIDMEDRKNQKAVYQALQEALKKTRSPSRVLPMNEFGLVVMTRKTVRNSLERARCMPCPACSGAGTIKSSTTVLSEIFSTAERLAANGNKRGRSRSGQLTLRVNPEVAKTLKRKSKAHLRELEAAAGQNILLRGDSAMQPDRFKLD